MSQVVESGVEEVDSWLQAIEHVRVFTMMMMMIWLITSSMCYLDWKPAQDYTHSPDNEL